MYNQLQIRYYVSSWSPRNGLGPLGDGDICEETGFKKDPLFGGSFLILGWAVFVKIPINLVHNW